MHVRSFEINFRTEFDDGYSAGAGTIYSQVIATEDIDMARSIARAMIGEVVSEDGLWLADHDDPKVVTSPPRPFPLENSKFWLRILGKLGLTVKRIRFIFNTTTDADKLQIVGFHIYRGPEHHDQDKNPNGPWKYY